jgi:hypothetical protein
MIVSAKNGVSSYETSRSLGITQKSAWFLMHRIRLALQHGSIVRKLMGEVGNGRNLYRWESSKHAS